MSNSTGNTLQIVAFAAQKSCDIHIPVHSERGKNIRIHIAACFVVGVVVCAVGT